MKLTEKIKLFCHEYIKDGNGSRAAIIAGYSKKAAGAQATRLLKDVKVHEYLSSLRKEIREKWDIDVDELITHLKSIALSDIRDYIDFSTKGITIKDSKQLTKKQAIVLSEVSGKAFEGRMAEFKFKMYDKLSAMDKLLELAGAYDPASRKKTNEKIVVSRKRIENPD